MAKKPSQLGKVGVMGPPGFGVARKSLKQDIRESKRRKARIWWKIAGGIAGFTAAGAIGTALTAAGTPAVVTNVFSGTAAGVLPPQFATTGETAQDLFTGGSIGGALNVGLARRAGQLVTLEGGGVGYTSFASRNARYIGRFIGDLLWEIFVKVPAKSVVPPYSGPALEAVDEALGY